jgi:hypothetical protein
MSVLIVTEKPEFGLQMRFPFSHDIKKDYKSKEAGEIERDVNVSNAIDRCKAICYDTGLLLCMLDQVSSNATSRTTYYFMTPLHPDGHGVMAMDVKCCQESSGAIITSPSGSLAMVSVQFQLLLIYDNRQMQKSAQKDRAGISGKLQGVVV